MAEKKTSGVAKRKLFRELMSGVQAMRAHREGQVTLRTHHVEPIAVPPIDPDFVRETREALLPLAFLAFSLLACGQPDSPPLPSGPNARDTGFPISPRQPCTEEARRALRSVDPTAIVNAAAHGVKLTCGEVDDEMAYPLPLDRAILDDRTVRSAAKLTIQEADASRRS
jgi:hypothetical protein